MPRPKLRHCQIDITSLTSTCNKLTFSDMTTLEILCVYFTEMLECIFEISNETNAFGLNSFLVNNDPPPPHRKDSVPLRNTINKCNTLIIIS